jgi:hypothetical protein
MRGIFAALQLMGAFFLAILGIVMAFHAVDNRALYLGALLGAIGLSFLAMLRFNIEKTQR